MKNEVEAQLGRSIDNDFEVVARCHLGLPIVISNSGMTPDGKPFPTRFWLTCPLAVHRIGRLESDGAVSQLNQRLESDSDFAAAVAKSHDAHDEKTDSAHKRGIGGTRSSIKCLHAHAAFSLSGGDSPAGAWALVQIGELNCSVQCVCQNADEASTYERNPEWRRSPE